MLLVKKTYEGKKVKITLTGYLAEDAGLEDNIGDLVGEAEFHTEGITRINSVGVQEWRRYFKSVRQKNVCIRFVNCSSAIIEQANFMVDFILPSEVVSLMIPFYCVQCKKLDNQSYSVERVRELNFQIPDSPCPQCKSPMPFDQVSEEYFPFLSEES